MLTKNFQKLHDAFLATTLLADSLATLAADDLATLTDDDADDACLRQRDTLLRLINEAPINTQEDS